ncbi:MAG: phosphoenolpyruvate carboxykinase (ATP) [Actinomycetota bacterium]|nr:phosphoenolpyruvate carboxykinase (ATP) [Actinomycetota bacterium]
MTDQIVGLDLKTDIRANLPASVLIEHALAASEASLADNGALVARTFERTGRSPKDKYLVRDDATASTLWWDNNQSVEPAIFEKLWQLAKAHLESKAVYQVDAGACADANHHVHVRLFTELAWHALFARQLFRHPLESGDDESTELWTILGAPTLRIDDRSLGLNSEAFISIDLSNKRVLVIGTQYAGEIKKSIFTVLNWLLPGRGVLPMHCSANVGKDGDVALFFGLSGTGKTTLSADPDRRLIGDDEHGWSDEGVFNFEGGCYAKCINLTKEKEPQIWDAIRFGSVLENVVIDPDTRKIDYDDATFTQNTRAAYPLDYIPGALPEGKAGQATSVVFLTADAFGVLPPVAKLTPDQAAYHFLSGFTSKLAGTEAGLGNEPKVTFSTCFGAPFLPLHPEVYSSMLSKKIEDKNVRVFLVNTGWTGGVFGEGVRIDLAVTRRIVAAAVHGELDDVPTRTDPIFGFEVPTEVEGVPSQLLRPRDTWKDPARYDAKAKELATKFQDNFAAFEDKVSASVKGAGPKV